MRRYRSTLIVVASLSCVFACEDGPKQLWSPNDGNVPAQNGFEPGPSWVPSGTKGFEDEVSGDSEGRARFCDESEFTTLVQGMVTQPIIPDTSLGGIPLWTPENTPTFADDLLGRPEDGKWCDAEGVYLNAFTWGPTEEIIVLFDEETRLVNGLIATQQYLGTLEGTYTEGSAQVPIVVKTRERVTIDGVELTEYTSSADQASKPNAWLNHTNITAIYKMVRETFFNASPFPGSFDCVSTALCDIIYTGADESVPQETLIVMQDSGVTLYFTPDGHMQYVFLDPVRVAPFEVTSAQTMGSGGTFAPTLTSSSVPGCTFGLDEVPTFATFKDRCVEDTRILSRVNYDVYTQRDAVEIAFNGVNLAFLRPTTTRGILKNGQHPDDLDTLFSWTFTRTMNSPVTEFVPAQLATLYKAKLEARLCELAGNNAGHPLCTYSLAVPGTLSSSAERIGELTYGTTAKNWIDDVVTDLYDTYYAMSSGDQAAVNPRFLDKVTLVEPFVDAVLQAFTHGQSELATSLTWFETTEDKRWSIGYAHFLQGGAPYRIIVQYSLNYGAITAITVERGYSELDTILNGINTMVRAELSQPGDYYALSLSQGQTQNPYRLGGKPIGMFGADRQLKMLNVSLKRWDGAALQSVIMTVPGVPRADEAGYKRQINGERYEWVPADEVSLFGKETQLRLFIEADGRVGYIRQYSFKGGLELCAGLTVTQGDDVRASVDAWSETVSPSDYRECNLVFNYSANGNVLYSVASLAKKVEIFLTNRRAVDAAIWR